MKFIWIITISLCTLKTYKCPHGCEVPHEHVAKECKDSLFAMENKQNVIDFCKANEQYIKRVDSLEVLKPKTTK